MPFCRETFLRDAQSPDAGVLCAALAPWRWIIESGYDPPAEHDPGCLLPSNVLAGAFALSLGSPSAVAASLGPALVDRLTELGCAIGPMAGLALHELIINAVIHGNLQVQSGHSNIWQDLVERQSAIAKALADPLRAARTVTIAVGWQANETIAVIADEGDGYDVATVVTGGRGCGRGLRLARMVGDVSVQRGGRQTVIAMESFCPEAMTC
jgi:hypothetical protein